jgi:hypothetical protein
VDEEVKVRPDGESGRVLPCLEALAVHEVVERLPVVEDCGKEGESASKKRRRKEEKGKRTFVTVRNRRVHR